MTQNTDRLTNLFGKIMMTVAALGALVTVVLRVWLSPAVINSNNGVLDAPFLVMGVMLVCLVGILVMAFFAGGDRREISGNPCIALAATMLAAAIALLVSSGSDLMNGLIDIEVMMLIQNLLGVLSGFALAFLAWRLLSERSTRRGIAQWTTLIPVLWLWMRVINYEMSYASLARFEDGFFGFAMLVFEMMFLFKLARYTAGVGMIRTGSMFFYSAATALFSLSGVAFKVIVYLMNDGMAVQAYDLAGAGDFAVGILALAVGITYIWGDEPAVLDDEPTEEEAFPDEGGDLIIGGDDEAAESDLI